MEGKVEEDYSLFGHRQVSSESTDCPGDTLYQLMQAWPHYVSSLQTLINFVHGFAHNFSLQTAGDL